MENEKSKVEKTKALNIADVSGSFTIIDWCKCKSCHQEVSPSQCDHMGQILFSDDRKYVVGFECWQCMEWITFPKNCR